MPHGDAPTRASPGKRARWASTWPATAPVRTAPYFQTITGTLVTLSDYSSALRKVMKTLGYSWSPHDLRHGFAATALSNGLSLLDGSRWLGHKSIKETADTYGHPPTTPRAGRSRRWMWSWPSTVLTWC